MVHQIRPLFMVDLLECAVPRNFLQHRKTAAGQRHRYVTKPIGPELRFAGVRRRHHHHFEAQLQCTQAQLQTMGKKKARFVDHVEDLHATAPNNFS